MSRVAGNALNPRLVSGLSIETAIAESDRVIVICSVDGDGRPHPAMLSRLEVAAIDARNIRLTTHGASRTTRHLRANGKLTLILADEEGVFYVKGDVQLLSPAMAAAPEYAMFNMRVESLLEDDPAAYEHARILTGIRIDRGAMDLARANAVLIELTSDADH